MRIMVYSLLWVVQDFVHQPYLGTWTLTSKFGLPTGKGFRVKGYRLLTLAMTVQCVVLCFTVTSIR